MALPKLFCDLRSYDERFPSGFSVASQPDDLILPYNLSGVDRCLGLDVAPRPDDEIILPIQYSDYGQRPSAQVAEQVYTPNVKLYTTTVPSIDATSKRPKKWRKRVLTLSRRRNKIINSADGWSNVVGKGRSPLRRPSELDKLGRYQGSWEEPIAPVDYERWLKETECNLSEKASEIKESELWRTIKSEIEKFVGIGNTKIRKVVILGLGSLSGNTKESSFYQLALVTEICTLLQNNNEHQCYPYYVQDPAFTSTDIRFFRENRKAIVLQHPEAETHINGETFLYAPHLEYEILQAALRYQPTLVFCNDMQNFLDTKIMGTKEYSELKDYVRDSNCLVFENVDKHDDIGNGRAFNHSALYWRKRMLVASSSGNAGHTEETKRVHKRASQDLVENNEDMAKELDESIQEIILDIKDYNICVDLPSILIKGVVGMELGLLLAKAL